MIYLHFGIYAAISLHKKGTKDASRTANAIFEYTIGLRKGTYALSFACKCSFLCAHTIMRNESRYIITYTYTYKKHH